jgi:hypothetical protein
MLKRFVWGVELFNRLLVAGCLFLVACFWLLVSGCLFLVAGYLLRVSGWDGFWFGFTFLAVGVGGRMSLGDSAKADFIAFFRVGGSMLKIN